MLGFGVRLLADQSEELCQRCVMCSEQRVEVCLSASSPAPPPGVLLFWTCFNISWRAVCAAPPAPQHATNLHIFLGACRPGGAERLQLQVCVCVCEDEENGEQHVNDVQLLCEHSLPATHSMKPSHLAPHQHGAEHHLQAIEEVVPDEDDGGAAGCPALARANGFDAGRGCFGYTGNMSDAVRNTERHEVKQVT